MWYVEYAAMLPALSLDNGYATAGQDRDRAIRNQMEQGVTSTNTLQEIIKGGGPELQPPSLLLCYEE